MTQITLYGSLTSPFVRRTRILLADRDYQFKVINVFDPAVRQEISKINPIVKIPFIQDGENVVFDSRQIYLYLSKKLSIAGDDGVIDNNLITVIDGTTEALITLFYLKRSQFDGNGDAMIEKINLKRSEDGFNYLNQQWSNRNSWKYADICLYTLLDWVDFRSLFDYSKLENLVQFKQNNQNQPFIQETVPTDG